MIFEKKMSAAESREKNSGVEIAPYKNLQTSHILTTVEFGHIDIDKPEVAEKIIETFKQDGYKYENSIVVYAGQPRKDKVKIVLKKEKNEEGVKIIETPNSRLIYTYDSLITKEPGLILTIRTADCLPILLSVKKQGTIVAVGAVHSGWQGLSLNIIQETIKSILELTKDKKTESADIFAAIGPHISQENYEFDRKFAEENFSSNDLSNALKEGQNKEKVLLSLSAMALNQFKKAGVPQENIFIDRRDTFNEQRFFSYRRAAGTNRSFASCITMPA